MSKSFELFRAKLANRLENFGAKSEFCRKTGIARSLLDKWLNGESNPSLEILDKAAGGVETQPWQLICPDDAIANSVGKDQHLKAMAEMSVKIAMVQGQVEGLRTALLEKTHELQRLSNNPTKEASKAGTLDARISRLPQKAQDELGQVIDDLIKGYELEQQAGQSKKLNKSS
ncbi:MAG: XRE family transcriptional regulator [Hyphomicrobiaceae bacterium]|nr:MAG: XRE family transcriptional regulator [Hyphomicrobiaceae bacterium]